MDIGCGVSTIFGFYTLRFYISIAYFLLCLILSIEKIHTYMIFLHGRLREKIEKHAGGERRAALSPIFTSRRAFLGNMSFKPALRLFPGRQNIKLMECKATSRVIRMFIKPHLG